MDVLPVSRKIGLVVKILVANLALDLASGSAVDSYPMALQIEAILEILPTQLAMICQLQ